MKAQAFVQSIEGQSTPLSELLRLHKWVATEDFLGLYAYATQSGVAAFDLALGSEFWSDVPSRWLFGIDYGRTQPQALRVMIEKPNTVVRIYDGAWVVERDGFLPRRDFHMKTSFLINNDNTRFGMVVGSGNFSSNGLRHAAECGAGFQTNVKSEFKETLSSAFKAAETLWNASTPAQDIIELYEHRWKSSEVIGAGGLNDPVPNVEDVEAFWIEAGYVTRNRGASKPGNQIDMPRGMSRYFGFNVPDDLPVKSIIGNVTFEPPSGELVSNNLRLGNNQMEKISLPIPERHGFGMYDGKVLVFCPEDGHFRMWALEAADFEAAFGHRLGAVRLMGSGRRYGYIK